MKIRLFGLVQDSIVDGPGLRMAVFVQGCSHHCPGCHNPASHDPSAGYEADTAEILQKVAANPLCGGLTLSGGEPFEQPGPCLELALGARTLGRNVWAYSGYTLEELRKMENRDIQALLGAVDVLVDGPFLLSRRSLDLKFRGSDNQRLIDMQKTGPGGIVLWQDPWETL